MIKIKPKLLTIALIALLILSAGAISTTGVAKESNLARAPTHTAASETPLPTYTVTFHYISPALVYIAKPVEYISGQTFSYPAEAATQGQYELMGWDTFPAPVERSFNVNAVYVAPTIEITLSNNLGKEVKYTLAFRHLQDQLNYFNFPMTASKVGVDMAGVKHYGYYFVQEPGESYSGYTQFDKVTNAIYNKYSSYASYYWDLPKKFEAIYEVPLTATEDAFIKLIYKRPATCWVTSNKILNDYQLTIKYDRVMDGFFYTLDLNAYIKKFGLGTQLISVDFETDMTLQKSELHKGVYYFKSGDDVSDKAINIVFDYGDNPVKNRGILYFFDWVGGKAKTVFELVGNQAAKVWTFITNPFDVIPDWVGWLILAVVLLAVAILVIYLIKKLFKVFKK